MSPVVIGLTGPMAAGKGEIVKILLQQDFEYITLSQFVRAEADRRGVSQERAVLQEVGNSMRQEGGDGVLGQRAKEMIVASAHPRWCVDGIRNPAEITVLRTLSQFTLIGVQANREVLVARMLSRQRPSDPTTREEALARIARELDGQDGPSGQRVDLCLKEVDHLIVNEGTLKELAEQVTHILSPLLTQYE